jgi:hypothetical protein
VLQPLGTVVAAQELVHMASDAHVTCIVLLNALLPYWQPSDCSALDFQ